MSKKKPAPKVLSSFDDLDAAGIGAGYSPSFTAEQPAQEDESPQASGIMRRAGDYGISVLKGAIGVPEAAIGLLDIPTGGRVGKALESVGVRPKEAKAMLDDAYSPEQKQAFQNVQQAEGFAGKMGAAIQNPSVIGQTLAESVPAIGAGGVVGRGLMAAAPRVGASLAAGAGEGVVAGGQAAEQIRQETPDGLLSAKQSALAALSGVGTAAFGALGSKVARSMGIHDVDTMLVSAASNPAAAKGVVRRVLEGAASEGILEELPQSVQEQVLQNAALGKDLSEGVDHAAVLGILSGAAMGGGANVSGASNKRAQEQEQVARQRATDAYESATQLANEASIDNLAGPALDPVPAQAPATYEDLLGQQQPAPEDDPYTSWDRQSAAATQPAPMQNSSPPVTEQGGAALDPYTDWEENNQAVSAMLERPESRAAPAPDYLAEVQSAIREGTQFTSRQTVDAVRSAMEDAWLSNNVVSGSNGVQSADAVGAQLQDSFGQLGAESATAAVDARVRTGRILSGLQNALDEGVHNTMQLLARLNDSLVRIEEPPLQRDEVARVRRMADAYMGFKGARQASPLPQLVKTAVDEHADNSAMEALIPERGLELSADIDTANLALQSDEEHAASSRSKVFDPSAVNAKTWPQFVLERGEKVSTLRKDTPAWNRLQHEWAALKSFRAGANPEGTGSIGAPTPEIQNRDRTRPASVVQMQGMAQKPDYMRLGVSRTPESGAPMAFANGDQVQAAHALGREDTAVMSDGQRVPFRYAVMEAADVQPSNFADGNANPMFDSDHPGVVKALNNGRTAGLRAAYERGTADDYKQEMMADSQHHGIDPEVIAGMKAPMLVRMYSEADNRTNMGAKSQSQALGLSAAEQAATDASLVDGGVLEMFDSGELDSAGNSDFARAFIGKLQAEGQDVAGMLDAGGALSPAGVTRLQAALVHKAYGDGDLVESMFGSMDNDIRAIGEALKSVAGEWANLRNAAEKGAINPAVDVTGNLLQAIRMVQKARRERASLHDAAQQVDMLTGEVPDINTIGVLRMLYSGHYMTRALGRERIADSLRDYMGAALATRAEADMFGEQVGPQSILAALSGQPPKPQPNVTANTATEQSKPSASEGERVTDDSNPVGSSLAESGQQARGQGPDRAGQATAEDGRSSQGQDAQDSSGQPDREGAQGNGEDGSVAVGETADDAQDAPLFSRAPETKQSYESRIDALFAGESPSRTGAKVLDSSDVLGLLGHPNKPVTLVESKVAAGLENHPAMTAEVWKKVPEWIENPAAVFNSDTDGGLVFIAPELVQGRPVSIILRPDSSGRNALNAHLLVNAYDRSTSTPFGRWMSEGLTRYIDKKEFPALYESVVGRRLPDTALQNKPGTARILTEKQLGGYRRANTSASSRGAGDSGMSPEYAQQLLRVMGNPKPTAEWEAQEINRVQSIVDPIRKAWVNGPKVEVVYSIDDPRIPESARKSEKEQTGQGAGAAEGFYHQGKVYLIASRLPTEKDAVRVFFHEATGHHGLRGAFGGELNGILDQIVQTRPREVVSKLVEYKLEDTRANRLIAAEEVLANMAEKHPELGFVRRAVAAIQTWLRANVSGFKDMRVSDDEIIRDMILPARTWVKSGASAQSSATAPLAAAMSRTEGGNAFDKTNDTVIADFVNDQPLKRHPDYKAAKAGDALASIRLVQDLVKPQSLEQAREKFGSDAVFVPVQAVESKGMNNIPNALAMHYANALGASVTQDIKQNNKAFHTGAGPMERLANRAEFDGKVMPGKRYVLVDDVTTMGSTLADMAAYIQRNGGQVVGSVVMTNAMRGGKISASPKTIKQLEARHGQAVSDILGIDADQLTGPEAQYLIGFKTTDEIRARATRSTHERVARLDAKTLPERQAGLTDQADDVGDTPMFSRTSAPATEGYSAAQAKAAERAFGSAVKQTLKERANSMRSNIGTRLRQGIVDQFAPIKEVSEKAYILARMSKGADGAVEAALMYGKPFLRDGVADVNVKDGGFAKVLASLKGEHDRFFQWVAAQRAERLKSEGKENLLTDQDITALKTLNAGQFADGSQRAPVYTEALRQLNAYNEASLKVALESGLIDQAAFDLMKDQPYVPFYRLMEEDGGMKGPRFSSGLVNQKAWKKLKGGTQQINADLLQNALMNWSHLYSAAARNRASLETMKAAEGMGVAYQVPADTKGAIKVMRDGIAEHWAVEDPYLLDAISAMSYTPGGLTKAMAPFKRLLTFGVTVNPTFKIRNLIRDSLSAMAQSDLSYNPFANVAKGWKATAKNSQTYASMLASGGIIQFGSQENTNHLRDKIAKLGGVVLDDSGWGKLKGQMKTVWGVYEEFGDRTENANRAALYERLIAKGHSHADASFMARDLMDFSMSGKWEVVRFLTQTVPFLNARLQGLYKLGRAAKEDPKRFAAIVGAVSAASLGLLAAYGDDDDWKKREDWDRDNYWWFKIGGTAFRIPKPFEVGAIGTVAERTAELMLSKEMTGKRFGARISDMVFNTFAMDPTPQAIKPFLDVYANKDSFSGRAIEGMNDERLRPQDRYNERTSEVARLLGSWGLPDPVRLVKGEYAGMSPKQVDFLLRGYFGWMATVGTTATDAALRPLLDRGDRPAMRMRDTFLAGNFVESLPTGSSRYVTAMYEQSKDIEQAWASYQEALKTGDRAKAQELREENAGKFASRTAMAHAKTQMADLGRQAKKIEASKDLPADQKRERLSALEDRKHQIAQRVSAIATR